MDSYLTDILNNGPLMLTVITGILVLLVEAARSGRPGPSSVIAGLGLAVAAVAAGMNLITEGESFSGMARHGGYANFFTLIFTIAGVVTVVLSRDYLVRMNWHRGEFYILVVFAITGMILIASANDLIVLFLGVELMSVCLYVIAGLMRLKDRSNESGLKYFLLGAFSTGFLLYGLALVYGASGTTNLTVIRDAFPSLHAQPVFLTGVGLLLVGFSFKVAAVPFHMWAPDVYEGAPTTATGFMSTAAKAAAFAGVVTLFIRTFDYVGAAVNDVIAIIAAASMILGNSVAIAQTNVKRMLAYSSVAHAGYMLSGIAGGTHDGLTGTLYYLAAYAAMNLGAFGIIGMLEGREDRNLLLDDYTGLSKQQPLLAGLMALFMFALAGIPPLAGFFGKYYVFMAAVKSGFTWLAIIGVLTSLVSAYYYLRLVVLMYFREGTADVSVRPGAAATITVVAVALIVVILGLLPSGIVETAQRFF